MYDKIIIDAKNVMSIFTYSMLSGKVACTFPNEIDEIRHRIFKGLLAYRLDYPDAEIFLALDLEPYWRVAYLSDWYSQRPHLDEVIYKGNRKDKDWLLETPEDVLKETYNEILYLICVYQRTIRVKVITI